MSSKRPPAETTAADIDVDMDHGSAPSQSGGARWGRREFMKSGLFLGVGALAMARGLATARPAAASNNGFQEGWRYCNRCKGMFYKTWPGRVGFCAAGGQHSWDYGSSLYYGFFNFDDGSNGGLGDFQPGWRFCGRCYQMTYAGFETGWCPGHGRHLPLGTSYKYIVPLEEWGYVPGYLPREYSSQPGWMYCGRCQNLSYTVGGPGPCAAGGSHRLGGHYHVLYLV